MFHSLDRASFEAALGQLSDARGNAAVAAAQVLRALAIGFRYAAASELQDVAAAAAQAVEAAPKTERASWTRAVIALAGGVCKDAKGTFFVEPEDSILEKDKTGIVLSRRVIDPAWLKTARKRASGYAAYLESASGYAGALRIKAAAKAPVAIEDDAAARRICSIIEQMHPHSAFRRQLLAALEAAGQQVPGKLAG